MADGIAAARRRLGPRPQVDSVLDQREPLADFPGGVVPDQPPAQPLRGLLEFGPPVLPMRQEHPRPRGDALGHELFGPDDVDGRSPDRRRLDGSPLERSSLGSRPRTRDTRRTGRVRELGQQLAEACFGHGGGRDDDEQVGRLGADLIEAEVSERVRPHLREHLRPVPGHGSAGEETAGPRTLLIVSHGPSSSPRLLIISFHHAPSPR